MLPDAQLRIEPYAVLYGGFRLQADMFADVFAAMGEDNHLYGITPDATVLSLSIDDRTDESVKLSWTYSRGAHSPRSADPIFRPGRAVEAAKEIPPAFFAELDSLPALAPPFDRVFVTPAARASVRYSWLLRSTMGGGPPTHAHAAEREGVVLLGDAAHACVARETGARRQRADAPRRMPIVCGDGANQAIRDAVALDEHLAALPDSPRTAARRYVEANHGRWQEANDAALHRLELLHSMRP